MKYLINSLTILMLIGIIGYGLDYLNSKENTMSIEKAVSELYLENIIYIQILQHEDGSYEHVIVRHVKTQRRPFITEINGKTISKVATEAEALNFARHANILNKGDDES